MMNNTLRRVNTLRIGNFWQILFAVLSLASSVSAAEQSYNVFRGYTVSNLNVSEKFNSTAEGACAFTCTAKQCSTVQFDKAGSCSSTALACSTLNLTRNMSNNAYVKADYLSLDGIPAPMLEWMLTDNCGLTNTGWLNPGLTMIPRVYGTANLWTPQYTVATNSSFGNVLLHQNVVANVLVSSYSSIPMNMSKSLTMFAYIWLTTSSSSFAIIEISAETGSQQAYTTPAYKLLFWIHGGGLYYFFSAYGCAGACGGGNDFYAYTVPVKQWVHVAVVYDASTSKVFGYLNGALVYISATTTFTDFSSNANYVVTNGRGDGGRLAGSIYCMKIYQAALNGTSISKIAKSCWIPTFRFT